MPNSFVNLPLPVTLNGAGAAVDTSAMGIPKTISLAGAFPNSTVAVQVSEDGGTSWGTLTAFQNVGGTRVLNAVASRMRLFVQGRKTTLPFSCDAGVGAPDATPQFGTIAAPAGNGAGAPLDISAFGVSITLVVEGSFPGAVVAFETSEDGTEPYAPLFAFSGQGGVKSTLVTANFIRMNVQGRKNTVPFAAVAALGATEAGGGGGGGGATVQAFRYTVTGLEPDLSDFFITMPVAQDTDTYGVSIQQSGVALIVGIDAPDLAPTDRTTTEFRVVSTLALQAGDQLDILISNFTN